MSAHVTVAVPVHNRKERMMRCLDALFAVEYPSWDVLVLDNFSTDGTAEACRTRIPESPVPMRVEQVPGNLAEMRLQGAALAEGELIAFVDSDEMPTPGWLAAAAAEFERDPQVGVVQGRTLPEPGEEPGNWAHCLNVPEWTGRFEGGNLILRTELLREHGAGLPERLGFYWEDAATGWSIMRAGWRATFAEGALVYHDVTYPGFAWWLRLARTQQHLPEFVRHFPEFRREGLWGRYFLLRRHAALVAAVAGLLLAGRSRPALLLALPYAISRRPQRLSPRDLPVGWLQPVIYDLAMLAALVRGSLRHRTLVL